jgi:hypothetical protein
MEYKLYRDVERDKIIGVFKYDDNKTSYIPMSIDNTDYKEYLEWVAKGNKAMEAE